MRTGVFWIQIFQSSSHLTHTLKNNTSHSHLTLFSFEISHLVRLAGHELDLKKYQLTTSIKANHTAFEETVNQKNKQFNKKRKYIT